MITATEPWEMIPDYEPEFYPVCPEDLMPDRVRERLDMQIQDQIDRGAFWSDENTVDEWDQAELVAEIRATHPG